MGKLPAFQFYPRDWMVDPELARVTPASRGVLMDVLCLMWESENRGVLVTGKVPWTLDEIAHAVRGQYHVVKACLKELLERGVLSKTASGAVFSRRMVRDEERRRSDTERQRRFRSVPGHGDVTAMSHRSSSSSSSSNPIKGKFESFDEKRRRKNREAIDRVFGDASEVANATRGNVPKGKPK
jgi:hypothetical protein